MFIYLNKRGQNTLEYAVLIAIVVAGLVAMQTYVKRGLQGRLRQAADDIGEQFSPGHTTSDAHVASSVTSKETVTGGDKSETKTTSKQTQDRTVDEDVSKGAVEEWIK